MRAYRSDSVNDIVRAKSTSQNSWNWHGGDNSRTDRPVIRHSKRADLYITLLAAIEKKPIGNSFVCLGYAPPFVWLCLVIPRQKPGQATI